MKNTPSFLLKNLGLTIFASRWLQAPLYLGLIIVQGVYVYEFTLELGHLLSSLSRTNETHIMLTVLGLIDVVMISNLLIMVIIGGYETFVSKFLAEGHPDVPEWLAHVNANTMKIKLSLALIGISSVHLLKTFINVEHLSEKTLLWQVVIHCTFIVSALAMAYTSHLTQSITHEG
ncbi:MAG: TIGR00645 family protein [Holosporales bacterium]|nr:TIGR00645 family protein [Holosporales bacterium]